MNERELQLRGQLGIPADAKQVILFAESSHWDPNWLFDSDTYYQRFVQPNLDRAIDYLSRDPRRVYSIECVFFLRKYWESNPRQHERVRELLNNRQLRMTSSGVTTADTLLPTEEALLRDFLVGQEWLRAQGIEQEPSLAYFTDSFGCTPALPSLLRAAGFDRAAFTRVDGMYFIGTDFEGPNRFPRKGSTAERLSQQLKTQDFIWRDANGAEVLCHWNAFGYGQGDMLAHRGIARLYLANYAIPDASAGNVRRRIHQFVRQLTPLARTPYLFCPIGFDFVEPLECLMEVIDRYNAQEYPHSGVWALNAGLDDYLALVEQHREALPVVEELDPNPYWTGFYTSRPALKKACRAAADLLTLAESSAVLAGDDQMVESVNQDLAKAWWKTASSNHHDLITGTSPDAVIENESFPWVQGAKQTASSLLQSLSIPPIPELPIALPTWERDGKLLHIHSPLYELTLSEAQGGCLIRAQFDGQELIDGPSNDLVSYKDSGGLWRMGHEMRGGSLRPLSRASNHFVPITIEETSDHLILRAELRMDDEWLLREWFLFADRPYLYGRLNGKAAPRTSLMLAFQPAMHFESLSMAQPGGVVERPLQKIFTPTYWPMQSFAHAHNRKNEEGFAFLSTHPAAIAARAPRQLEVVALRNAPKEKVYGLIGLPAYPAEGMEKISTQFDYAIGLTTTGGWRENDLQQHARLHRHFTQTPEAQAAAALLEDSIRLDAPTPTEITALKPAQRGEGLILRLRAYDPSPEPVILSFRG
ncbi:MAG: hypothetical protein JW750_11965, partial [Anaerolineaceae bacterium]|nr:hypothetical protein [Anaerolineaceae bacterium]